MADTTGPPPRAVSAPAARPAIAAALAAAPWAWSLFAALRRLEAAWPDRPRLGRSTRAAQDAVRLAQDPTVEFAPASLAAWEEGDAETGAPPRLLVRCFGLFGADGPLPLHLTEYARDRRRNHRDATFQHFADIFHHRALSLFYRAWAEVRPTVAFDRPAEDRFARFLGALIGIGMPALRDRDAMPDLARLHFGGLLAGQTRHAEGLATILAAFFGTPVQTESFVGAWLALPAADRTRLGTTPRTAALGGTALLGGRIWSRQHKFRLVFGPLGHADYQRMLPGGESFRRLVAIVRFYAGDALLWDVQLILRRADVPATALGRAGRLGWTTWLMPRPAPDDAADLCLDPASAITASESAP